jgi:hypothetical protein
MTPHETFCDIATGTRVARVIVASRDQRAISTTLSAMTVDDTSSTDARQLMCIT